MNVETILKFPSNSFLLCEMGTGLQNSWYRGYGTGYKEMMNTVLRSCLSTLRTAGCLCDSTPPKRLPL